MSFLCTAINRKVSYHQCVNECQYFFKSACIDKMNEAYQQGRADTESEHKEMCESCIHKVSAEDIEQIRADAIDEMLSKIHTTWLFRGNDAKAYREEIDYIAEQLKEQK